MSEAHYLYAHVAARSESESRDTTDKHSVLPLKPLSLASIDALYYIARANLRSGERLTPGASEQTLVCGHPVGIGGGSNCYTLIARESRLPSNRSACAVSLPSMLRLYQGLQGHALPDDCTVLVTFAPHSSRIVTLWGWSLFHYRAASLFAVSDRLDHSMSIPILLEPAELLALAAEDTPVPYVYAVNE